MASRCLLNEGGYIHYKNEFDILSTPGQKYQCTTATRFNREENGPGFVERFHSNMDHSTLRCGAVGAD